MNDHDEQLRRRFQALREEDARHAPTFQHTLRPASTDLPAEPLASVAARARRSFRFWQISLGTTFAAIALVAILHRPATPSAQPHSVAVAPAQATTWQTPSDILLADNSATDLYETSASLIHEIDRLLDHAPRHL